jgi:hypothetical protein
VAALSTVPNATVLPVALDLQPMPFFGGACFLRVCDRLATSPKKNVCKKIAVGLPIVLTPTKDYKRNDAIG